MGFNLESLRGLANFAALSEGFTIAFAEVNFSGDADILMDALKRRPECQDIQFEILDFSATPITSLLTELNQILPTLSARPTRR